MLRPLNFLLLVFFLSFSCCSSPKKSGQDHDFSLSAEEHECLRQFFRNLLFYYPGAYTLFGTKPISAVCITHLTEEDKIRQNEYLQTLSEEERLKKSSRKYDHEKNYEKWNEIKSRFPIRQYLFGSFRSSVFPNDKKTKIILFVNIEETVKILLNHYADFRRTLGCDFDPLTVVFEVENPNSEFWNAVMKHHALQGILFGYGADNAWCFEWSMKYHEDFSFPGKFIQSLPSTCIEERIVYDYGPKDFHLPTFRIYGFHPDLCLIERYKKERERIKALYVGRDEVDVTLEQLTR